MSKSCTIRPATADDLDAIQTLLANTWHDTYDEFYGRDRVTELTARWHSIDHLQQMLDCPNTCFLVAGQIKQIAAVAVAKTDDRHTVSLAQLYVDPTRQRGGLGGALLHHILENFPKAHRIILQVEPENRKAVNFYRRNGFEVTGQTADCGATGDNIPALEMTLILGEK